MPVLLAHPNSLLGDPLKVLPLCSSTIYFSCSTLVPNNTKTEDLILILKAITILSDNQTDK